MKHCPTDTDLKRFLTGRLEDARIDRIGDHLSSCGACLDVLNTISCGDDSVDDTFGQTPASAWPQSLIEESLCQLMESPPDWLQTDPLGTDFIRVSKSHPLAESGAGGDLPTYIGAVPPGPPPVGGDWLSRARLRFANVQKIARETFTRSEADD